MTDLTLKRGDTLLADCTYRDAIGDPVNLDTAGITVKSAVRSPDGRAFFDLEYAPKNQVTNPGEFTLRGDSSNWINGEWAWDIRYIRGEDSFSSRTIRVKLLESVTQ